MVTGGSNATVSFSERARAILPTHPAVHPPSPPTKSAPSGVAAAMGSPKVASRIVALCENVAPRSVESA
jgi:hypothetical protein